MLPRRSERLVSTGPNKRLHDGEDGPGPKVNPLAPVKKKRPAATTKVRQP
jgi:hypothetical protein